MRIFITFFLLVNVVIGYSYSKQEVMDYIELYKLIAVEEMQENGIPASIKMAQAILESNAGKSDLALQANNHFGIKCGGVWSGPTYYKKDDDRDRRGRLIKSCFRVFVDAEDSFRAHSQFLLDPKKTHRYGPLFDLNKNDYKSWAWGLSKAGYATNPAYANLLIHLIEKYALYTFDYYEDSNVKYVNPSDLVVEPRDITTTRPAKKVKPQNRIVSRPEEPVQRRAVEHRIEINRREVVKVAQGQTMEQLARKYEISPRKILKYNDNNLELDENLEDGMFIYLEKKRIWYRGSKRFHVVQEGEDLSRISQIYGIRLSTLERKNRIRADMVPVPGEKIFLKGRARGDEIPVTYDDVDIVPSANVTEPVLAEQLDMESQSKSFNAQVTPPTSTPESAPEVQVPVIDLSKKDVTDSSPVIRKKQTRTEPKQDFIEYEVVKGDTLYGISRKFGVSVDSIRQNNHLRSNQIQIGQQLKIVQ